LIEPALRVLVVEDEMLVAMNIEDMLLDLGHEVAALASRLDAALTLAREGNFEVAMLDVNLAGQASFPVADVLRERGIPYLFATGYGVQGIAEDYRAAPVLQKPFRARDLGEILKAATQPYGRAADKEA
jgi:CheY-like chemotaxis protein